MPAIPSQLTSLDFFEIKESIRSYLRTRKEFTDYDFEGSAASYLIDILAYNTYYTAFNANMSLNEAFLESATVRDNIVRIAKQLNYTPRSVKAPKACVHIKAQTTTGLNGITFPEFCVLHKGDVFVADNALDTFTFTLTRDIQVPVDTGTGIADFSNVIIYQGNLLSYNYTVDYTKNQEYIVPAENVDTELLTIDISPNAQSEEKDTYNLAGNVTSLDENSRVYYLEETDDQRYKAIFGDGVIGRRLIDGEYITMNYVTTYGIEANGADRFAFIGQITDSDGRVIPPQSIKTTTMEKAQQGEDAESSLSIKFRAPRAYSTQNRAVTESDYEHIVTEIYPQAASVTAYGGEKLDPPVYGKVYVAIRPKTGNKLNAATKVKIEKDLRKFAVASIQPEVIDPTSFYIIPKVYAYYDGNATSLSGSQLATKILQSIDEFNRNGQTDRFNNRIEGSKFGAMVDNSDTAISGNVTQLALGQNLDKFAFGQVFTQCLNFGNPLYDPSSYSGDSDGVMCKPNFSVVKSGTFYATDYTEDLVNLTTGTVSNASTSNVVFSTNETTQVLVPVNIRDDGMGNLMLVTTRDETEVILNAAVGTVDYASGQVCVGPIAIQQTPDGTEQLPISVMPISPTIEIPPGVDPTFFNPIVNPIDYNTQSLPIASFDPNNFSGYNLGDTSGLNIIDYPSDTFTYPVDTSCF